MPGAYSRLDSVDHICNEVPNRARDRVLEPFALIRGTVPFEHGAVPGRRAKILECILELALYQALAEVEPACAQRHVRAWTDVSLGSYEVEDSNSK